MNRDTAVAINILTNVVGVLLKYLYSHIDNPELREKLIELGQELKRIKSLKEV